MNAQCDCWLAGIGAWAPGVASWAQLAAVLGGATPPAAAPDAPPPATLLAAAERRRAAPATRVALQVAAEALEAAAADPTRLHSVFATSSGSPEVTDEICAMLAAGDWQLSPTRFHNSVHNAAAGYYGIATGARGPSTTVCAYDDAAAAGLLECAGEFRAGAAAVLLVSFDLPYGGPLAQARPVDGGWGIGLVLAARPPVHALARLRIAWCAPAQPATPLADPALERLRLGNPTARLLPLLQAVAGAGGRVVLAGPGHGTLAIEVIR